MKKTDLLQALEIVKPGLANREKIEQSTSFAFIEGKVVTYNDEISLSHPVEGLDITGAVQAAELYELLRKIKQDDIEISVEDNEIQIKAGKATAGLTLHQEIKLPLEEIGEAGKWKTIPEGFLNAVKMSIYSTGKNLGEPLLTCVHVNENGYIEGSDGLRIIRYQINKMPVKTFLIPYGSASEVVKLNPIKIAEGKGWIHFKTEKGTIMSCRIFEEAYPETSGFLKVNGVCFVFPQGINDILDRAMVFSSDTVNIKLDKKKISIKSESEAGWFEESANVRYEDKALSFIIAPVLLKNILSETLNCTYDEKLLKFEGENWVYVAAININ